LPCRGLYGMRFMQLHLSCKPALIGLYPAWKSQDEGTEKKTEGKIMQYVNRITFTS